MSLGLHYATAGSPWLSWHCSHDTAVELELEAVRLTITFTVLQHTEALRATEEAAPACLQGAGLQKSAVCKERATSGCDVGQDPVATANQTSSPRELQKSIIGINMCSRRLYSAQHQHLVDPLAHSIIRRHLASKGAHESKGEGELLRVAGTCTKASPSASFWGLIGNEIEPQRRIHCRHRQR